MQGAVTPDHDMLSLPQPPHCGSSAAVAKDTGVRITEHDNIKIPAEGHVVQGSEGGADGV